jgi:hypothetical protein
MNCDWTKWARVNEATLTEKRTCLECSKTEVRTAKTYKTNRST